MFGISTQDLSGLPDVAQLRKLLQSLATLDAILCPEWQFRYYSFNAHWGEDESMGSMRNGQGDDCFALFNRHGCFLKGFVHDSPLAGRPINPEAHYQGLPGEFRSCVNEPAFKSDEVSFCIWRMAGDSTWSRAGINMPRGNDPDGSSALLSPLDGNAEKYQQWAECYYREGDLRTTAVDRCTCDDT
jgi:hypothetical protein